MWWELGGRKAAQLIKNDTGSWRKPYYAALTSLCHEAMLAIYEEVSVTLYELIQLLRRHLRLVVGLTIAAAVLMGVYAFAFMRDTYTATTSMYVLVSQDAAGQGSSAANSLQSDLNSSEMITTEAAELLKSSRVEKQVAEQLDLNDLKSMDIDVESTTGSRVITLNVTGSNATTVAINIIDEAETPTTPSGPNRKLYVAVAAMAGLFVAVAIVVLQDMLNTRVRSEEMLEEITGLPIMGRIPMLKSEEGSRG